MRAAGILAGLDVAAAKRNWLAWAHGLRGVFAWRCAGSDCPLRGKLWPAWLNLRSGIEFEGRWYCGVFCLQPVLEMRVAGLFGGLLPERVKPYRHALGALLIGRGVISRDNLQEALRLQRLAGTRKIGDWLREMRAITEEQLVSALGQQWGCPVFPLEHQPAQRACLDLVPVHLLEFAHAVPAHLSPDGGTLHMAFADHLDHSLLYAVGVMLGCQTFACVAAESAVAMVLVDLRRGSDGNQVCFESFRDPREVTRTICSYAGELQASRVTMARVAGHLWIRFRRIRSSRDLLFRLFSDTPQFSPDTLDPPPKVY